MASAELNAAFFAFHKRERGGVLLTTSIAYLVITLLLSAAVIAALWTQIAPMLGWYMQTLSSIASGNESGITTPPFGNWIWLGLGYTLWFLLFGFITAAFEAACLRWMVHGEHQGFFGFTFGADTWRVYGTYWMWVLGVMVFYLVVVLAIAAVVAAASLGAPRLLTTLLGLLTPVVFISALLFFGVRFAPAAATSVARRRFAFFDAWKVTKGRFWELLGAFVIVIAIYVGVSIAVSMVTSTVVFGSIMSGVDWQSMATDEQAFLQSYMNAFTGLFTNPVTLALYGVSIVLNFSVSLLIHVMFFGVNARAAQAALEEGKIAPAAA